MAGDEGLTVDSVAQCKKACCWEQLTGYFNRFSEGGRQWIFRGHKDSSYSLQSTLERAIYRHHHGSQEIWDKGDRGNGGCYERAEQLRRRRATDDILKGKLKSTLQARDRDPMQRPATVANIEAGLIRHFKRKCHLFLDQPPEFDEALEWLALMRHYGRRFG
jgi:hypothetical protein